jgi:immune inhibitor A
MLFIFIKQIYTLTNYFLVKNATTINGYRFVADDIQVTSGSAVTFSNGAETLAPVSLNGFNRIMDTIDGDSHYYIQLRDHNGTDSGLTLLGYDPGVLVWYRDEDIENNNVSEDAGELFIGVVDADQNLIMRNNTIRKAR